MYPNIDVPPYGELPIQGTPYSLYRCTPLQVYFYKGIHEDSLKNYAWRWSQNENGWMVQTISLGAFWSVASFMVTHICGVFDWSGANIDQTTLDLSHSPPGYDVIGPGPVGSLLRKVLSWTRGLFKGSTRELFKGSTRGSLREVHGAPINGIMPFYDPPKSVANQHI